MKFLNFGSRIRNRKFDYIPQHYDPDKEELEQRLKRYKSADDDTDVVKQRIRGSFKRGGYIGKDDYTKRTQRRSNKILMFTLIGLLILSYIFITRYLPQMARALEGAN